jgi:predicted RecB family nuclease
VFEFYYRQKVYRHEHKALPRLQDKTEEYFEGYLSDHYVNFNHITCPYDRDEALDHCLDAVEKTERAILREKLIGYKNLPEMTVSVPFEPHIAPDAAMKGRLDFCIQRKVDGETETIILDGKATKHPDRVDEDQILFYTLLFTMRYRFLPDRIGYLFFRHGDDEDKAIRWHDVNPDRLQEVRSEAIDIIHQIRNDSDWDPQPDPSYCQWCQYEDVCDARQEQKEANRRSKMSEDEKTIRDHLDNEDGNIIGSPPGDLS